MLQLTAQMRVLVAVQPVNLRRGIDGLCRLCRTMLETDPFGGTVFVFRNKRGTSVKLLTYDGQGFWLCQKRLSSGRFRYWPTGKGEIHRQLLAHQVQVLLAAGDPESTHCAPEWRPVRPAT